MGSNVAYTLHVYNEFGLPKEEDKLNCQAYTSLKDAIQVAKSYLKIHPNTILDVSEDSEDSEDPKFVWSSEDPV